MKTTSELQAIAASGAGLIIDGRSKTTRELQAIVASARASVTIRNAGSKTTRECQAIAASGSDKVILDFTKT